MKKILILAFIVALVIADCPASKTNCDACNDNDQCVRCKEEFTDNTPQSDCECALGQYKNTDGACTACPGVCDSCELEAKDGETSIVCTGCKDGPGLGLNLSTKQCECQTNYFKDSGSQDPASKCSQLYIYGNKAVESCPDNSTPNEEIHICEITKPEEVSNDDKIHIIIVSCVIIVVQFVLSILLYNYLFNKLKEAFTRDQNAVHELTPEERAYLANQEDYEREIALREEADRKSKSKMSSNLDDQSDVIE